MRESHSDKGPLHGITVVVDAGPAELWVGRCFEVTDEGVVLLDADVLRDADEAERARYLKRASQVGVWNRVPRTVVPRSQVVSVRRLVDLPE